jgi:hypothetical protein
VRVLQSGASPAVQPRASQRCLNQVLDHDIPSPSSRCDLFSSKVWPLQRRAWRECAAFAWRSQVRAHGMKVPLRTADAICRSPTQGFTALSVNQVMRTPSAIRCPRVPRPALPQTWLQASCACPAKLGCPCPSTWSSLLTPEQTLDLSIPSLSFVPLFPGGLASVPAH